jgi:hypothetical protein
MKTIKHQGTELTRNEKLEIKIKKECKYYNSNRHHSERLNFKTYCEYYYAYLIVKNNKVYSI